ncbi:MAG: antirestriction protein ArdA [Clostridia bacterium]|nr:antirestriction protein ArdA [Clostridia bacterium]
MITTNSISIVIGSWGSYNACNSRALGSRWLDLSLYLDWKEIEDELKAQGFDLDGIDEELFIQDVENFPGDANWDYVHPKTFFELLKESGVLDNDYKYRIMEAYIEVEGYRAFEQRVKDYGEDWDGDIYLYPDTDWYDLGYQMINEYIGTQIPSFLENYIDYARYGEEFSYEGYHEYSGGIIEIR